MFKILQARLQQYVTQGLPDAKAGFRKGRVTRNKNCQNPLDNRKKTRELKKNKSTSALLTMLKSLCGSQQTGKFFKRYHTTLPASCETCMQVKKQQLELDIEQQTGSK